MAAISDIVINDGTSSVTFVPSNKDGATTTWAYKGASAELDSKIVATAKWSQGSYRKVRYVLNVPYVETDLNANRTYHNGYVNVDLNVPRNMPVADITKLRTYLIGALSNAIISDQFDNGNNPY